MPNYGVYFNLNDNPKSLNNSAKKVEKKDTLKSFEGRSPRKENSPRKEYDIIEQEYLDYPKSKNSPKKGNSGNK